MKTRVIVCALALSSIQLACGGGDDTPAASVPTVFTTGQAASLVMGQTSMTANTSGMDANQNNGPVGVFVTDSGQVLVSERNGSRVAIYNSVPTANAPSADLMLGQTATNVGTFTGHTAVDLNQSVGATIVGTKAIVVDQGNDRVLIYNSIGTGAAASVAIGQTATNLNADPGSGGVSATVVRGPAGVAVSGTKMLIADGSYNRVLVYNSIPTTNAAAASLALGQLSLTASGASAATMNGPAGVWTNGTKIVVCETNGHRCLIWNSWPTTSNATPDVVLGQSSLATNSSNNGGLSARSMFNPNGVTSNGTELYIADSSNNRVLGWKTWPTASGQAADLVFGQSSFTASSTGVSATTMNTPSGVALSGSSLFVADTGNHRVLIFKKQ